MRLTRLVDLAGSPMWALLETVTRVHTRPSVRGGKEEMGERAGGKDWKALAKGNGGGRGGN